MLTIRFQAKLFRPDASEHFGSAVVLALPKSASAQLPSRGMTVVKGTLNGSHFRAVLEPDGKGSHWFKVDKALREAAKADVGDTIALTIEPTKDWPEPKVPADLEKALEANSKTHSVWLDITPMARWDWIRWIGAAKQTETRQRRINVACSKLRSGTRRPCCFNHTECTLTEA